jgi:site-specific recombinase XerD
MRVRKDAVVYVRGNLAHSFRDTFVDYLLGQGCDMTTVAALLGDSVAVTEKHYADLASARMRDRLAAVPVRQW